MATRPLDSSRGSADLPNCPAVGTSRLCLICLLPAAFAQQSYAVVGRSCSQVLADGRVCRATPLLDEPYCFWHAPERAEDAAEARRLGGLRRRREKTVSSAYEFAGLGTIESIRRILEIATIDALGLVARVLIAAAMAAAKLLEVGELEDRLTVLEAAMPRTTGADPIDVELVA